MLFVDDVTAFMKGRNKGLVEMAEMVLKNVAREVYEKGLKLSITEGGKEGAEQGNHSCRYLEERFQERSKKGGVALDLRTRTKHLGAKEKARRKNVM